MQKAVAARWDISRYEGVTKAHHSGVIKIGNIEVECAVLSDGVHVLSERVLAKVFSREMLDGLYSSQTPEFFFT
ncbi:hypothetical protein [Mycoavidus cysteinexigens]|uniref:hypothetical protein n=1 Tax=Mycoavidus cysteinexigens TaxID=1553431 RepID=UPI000F84C17D|nr:hypothetical protein [Mycoavidus cysteinexigens]